MKQCSIGECNGKHYLRVLRHDDPYYSDDFYIHNEFCTVKGCTNKYQAKGFCMSHYYKDWFLKHPAGVELAAWNALKNRCFSPINKSFKNYGGRGITVYSGWVNDFDAFYTYIGPKPTPKHSIDRIDNDGNYEPGNVRWATQLQQANNKRPKAKRPEIVYNEQDFTFL